MERIRLGLLWLVCVLAFVTARQLVPPLWFDLGVMPPPWWEDVYSAAASVVVFYPFFRAAGIFTSDRTYVRFALGTLVLVGVVSALPIPGREYVTLGILLFAAGGWLVTRHRRHAA